MASYHNRHIGKLFSNGQQLRENSPVRGAGAIKVPVLLVHGEKDRSVDVSHGRSMANAMKSAGVQHRYIEFKKGDHYLSEFDHRLRFLKETESFLGNCLN